MTPARTAGRAIVALLALYGALVAGLGLAAELGGRYWRRRRPPTPWVHPADVL